MHPSSFRGRPVIFTKLKVTPGIDDIDRYISLYDGPLRFHFHAKCTESPESGSNIIGIVHRKFHHVTRNLAKQKIFGKLKAGRRP